MRVEGDPSSAVLSTSEGELDVVFTVRNAGTAADVYDLEFADSFRILKADIPDTVSLEAGAEQEFTVPISFEGGGTISGTWELRLTATSQRDPQVVDEATCSLSFE